MNRLLVLVVLLACAVAPPAAHATSSLSLSRGKAKITAVFRQELTDAIATAVSSKVGPCSKPSRSTVVCFTAAKMNDGGNVMRCSKYYRARLVGGRVSVTESATGARWRRHAQGRCVTA